MSHTHKGRKLYRSTNKVEILKNVSPTLLYRGVCLLFLYNKMRRFRKELPELRFLQVITPHCELSSQGMSTSWLPSSKRSAARVPPDGDGKRGTIRTWIQSLYRSTRLWAEANSCELRHGEITMLNVKRGDSTSAPSLIPPSYSRCGYTGSLPPSRPLHARRI